MKIIIRKHSDQAHELTVVREDGTSDSRMLNSRSFLRHDLAHLAVEMEVPIHLGYWGLVAAGAALDGMGIHGPDIGLAESLAGPVQTLMRKDADADAFYVVLQGLRDGIITREISDRICERCRQLSGHWRATPFGGEMVLVWGIRA